MKWKEKSGILSFAVMALLLSIALLLPNAFHSKAEKPEGAKPEEPKKTEEVKEWKKDKVYVAGDRVTRNGILYEAAWWTLGEDPAKQKDEWSVWKRVKATATEERAPLAESFATKQQTTEKEATKQQTTEKETTKQQTTEKEITKQQTTDEKSTKPTTEQSADTTSQKRAVLPDHLVTGYWQNFDNGAMPLKIRDVPEGYTLIAVAFAEATATPGKVTFRLDETLCSRLGGYTKKQFIQDIRQAKKKGQRVILSVGGEIGTVSVSTKKEAKRFADSVYQLMQEYGFDGVDIDLEHGIEAEYMEQALRRLSDLAGEDLIITMAPQTLDMQNIETEYFKLARSIQDILTIVNTQYYNSGTMLGADGKVYAQGNVDFLTALAVIPLENGLRPDQVGLGVPASVKGAGSGYVSPSVVGRALNCLAKGKKGGSYQPEQTYPTLRGVMCWSINWDAANEYAFLEGILPTIEKLP